MTAGVSPTINSNLTTEQAEIAEAPPSVRMLVTAGPGTGKTHVLVHRLLQLVERHDLAPGQEVLVLSFSRAAVREIRQRVATAGAGAGYVRAFTFDSFATRMLSQFDPDGAWVYEDYDGRIRAAVGLLRDNKEAQEELGGYLHVLVDEVQDLVGERSEFVRVILETVAGGFTVLGDPAQGIYNFQLEGEKRRTGSAELYQWLRTRFRAALVERHLTQNHRAQTAAARAALWAGAELNGPDPDYGWIKDKLDTVVFGLPSVGKVDDAIVMLRSSNRSTAVLCRNNGEALMISRKLCEAGVAHRLQRSATDRVVPAWIATVLGGLDQQQVGRTAFTNAVTRHFSAEELDPDIAWRALKQIDGRPTNTLDVGRVAERIRVGNVPDELTEQPSARLVVSTVHRAKGLEFERVIVCPSQELDDDVDELPEETRVLYVALTRPKRELLHMEIPSFKGLYKHKKVDRWIRQYGSWKLNAMEICGHDVHGGDPAGGLLLDACDPQATQAYIRSSVRPGDRVTLEFIKAAVDGEPRAFYAIIHNGRPVGITAERFGGLLYRVLKLNAGWKVNWPVRIEDLYVDTVDTAAGTNAAGRRCGLGSSGLWLRVRIVGLGHLVFEKFDK